MRNETHRLYGPGNTIFPRKAVKEHYLGKVLIPEGTLLELDFCPNNYNPVYYKEPEEFRPERWLNGELTKLNPFVLIPFSSGQRNCIGQHLARIEAKIMASKFLVRYDYVWKNAQTMKLKKKLMVTPESTLVQVAIRENIN